MPWAPDITPTCTALVNERSRAAAPGFRRAAALACLSTRSRYSLMYHWVAMKGREKLTEADSFAAFQDVVREAFGE